MIALHSKRKIARKPRLGLTLVAFAYVFSFANVMVGFQATAPEIGPKGRIGIEMVANKSYDRAVTYLEDGLKESPDNPVLYEQLGVAYLGCGGSIDSTTCLKKAEEAMDKAIKLGGQATFVVDRSLDKKNILLKAPNPLNMQRGMLHVNKEGLVFQSDKKTDAASVITIPVANIKDYGLNSHAGKSTNVFHLTGRKEGVFDFRTANFSAEEAQLLFRLIERHLGVSPK